MSDDKDSLWRKFDQLGEEEVRRSLAAGQYGERKKPQAREWLAYQESTRSAAGRASDLAFKAEANESSREVISVAREANELARAANATAEDAAASARLTAAEAAAANRQARRANTIAIAAAAIAVISAIVAIIAPFL